MGSSESWETSTIYGLLRSFIVVVSTYHGSWSMRKPWWSCSGFHIPGRGNVACNHDDFSVLRAHLSLIKSESGRAVFCGRSADQLLHNLNTFSIGPDFLASSATIESGGESERGQLWAIGSAKTDTTLLLQDGNTGRVLQGFIVRDDYEPQNDLVQETTLPYK